jgi:hypothetical protein
MPESRYAPRQAAHAAKSDPGVSAASRIMFKPLRPLERRQVPWSIRALSATGDVLFAFALVLGIVAAAWGFALSLSDAGAPELVPFALLAIGLLAAWLCRRYSW